MLVVKQLREKVIDLLAKGIDPFPEIFGQERAKKAVLSALVAGRHVIIIGYPGVGKTTLAKSVAKLLPTTEVIEGCEFNCTLEKPVCPACVERKSKGEPLKNRKSYGYERFIRVQGSPDLQVEDLLGDIDPVKALKYGPANPIAFTPGKLLRANGGVLFFDEINRCPERLQNSLLQVIEEGVATIGGYEIEYPSDFIMIATMNPTEYVGTERLSEVLLDRFDLVEMHYPETAEVERKIVLGKGKNYGIKVSEGILDLIVEIVRSTREDERIERPAGVRATIGIYERAQTTALLAGRKEVEREDVESVVRSVLSHRIKLAAKFRHVTAPEDVVDDLIKNAGKKKPPGKKQTQETKPPEATPSQPQSKPVRKEEEKSKMLRSMLNRNIQGISAKFLAKAIVSNFENAIATFGEDILQGLTGLGISDLKKLEGKPDGIYRLSEQIEKNLKTIKDDNLVSEEGITEEGLDIAVLSTLLDELQILGRLGYGEHEARKKGGDVYPLNIKPYRHERYRSLAVRRTLQLAIKRGHEEIRREDLQVWEKAKRTGINFVFALDASGSMRGSKIDSCKRAAIGLAYLSLKEGDKVAVVAFRKHAQEAISFNEDLETFARKVVRLTPHSTTNMAEGIRLSREMLQNMETEKHIILITDALPTEGESPLEKALEETSITSNQGITISVVGISLSTEGEEIARKIAGLGNGTFYPISDVEKLNEAILQDREKVKSAKR